MLYSSDRRESLLYSYFHEFHRELLSIKNQIESGQMVATSNLTENGQHNPFQQTLINLLERQSIDAARRGGEHGARLYREAQYLMVAFADEFFLHLLDWAGKESWQQNQLLEVKMFKSQAAGQRVFENLEKLLKKRDPMVLELARLYLIVLSLGFQGQYRGIDDGGQLQSYRHQLFFFITQRDPSELDHYLHHDSSKRLCPDAYAFTLDVSHEQRRWLPPLYKWYLAAILLIFGFLLSSTVLWESVSHELKIITTKVLREN